MNWCHIELVQYHDIMAYLQSIATVPDPKVRLLLRSFRGKGRFRAGSLLVTIFGDSIAPRGGEVALASLIELARPLGLPERLVRTSVGRLAKENWVQAGRVGRYSYYRLTARGRGEFDVATERIYGDSAPSWDGVWTLVLISALRARERRDVTQALRWRGFGQIMPGVLAYPGDRAKEVNRGLPAKVPHSSILILRGRVASTGRDAAVISRAWDLDDLDQRYRRFVRLFELVSRALERSSPEPVTCFVVRTLLIHEYRRIHLRDPLLPRPLLPGSWTGHTAARLARKLYRRLFRRAEMFLSARAHGRVGSLPPASIEALHRFGGLKP